MVDFGFTRWLEKAMDWWASGIFSYEVSHCCILISKSVQVLDSSRMHLVEDM